MDSAVLERDDAAVFAYARGLANWQASMRHCSWCGTPLTLVDGGHRAACSGCGRLHFPRTDAAIIVIVEQGDACLLGRQAAWPPRQYSTLAGFVEPGESLADAVRREVREEIGAEIGALTPVCKLGCGPGTGWEFLQIYRAEHEGPFAFAAQEVEGGAYFSVAQVRAWLAARPTDFTPIFRMAFPAVLGELPAAVADLIRIPS